MHTAGVAGGDSVLADKLYVCQMLANVYVETGDSGGSIFLTSTSGLNTLAGIVWARHQTGLTYDGIIFSSIDGVHFDLGPMAAYPHGSLY
jgi:hypothetical protein